MPTDVWHNTRAYLLSQIPELARDSSDHDLLLRLDDEDWILELGPDGILRCQAGYELEDMRSILSDGTAEDLGNDELAKQVKFYLQQATAKYRPWLLQHGCEERVEMTGDYVAVSFEKPVELNDPKKLLDLIRSYQARFRSSGTSG
ncbi:MAG: hypothetical protein D6690_01945 [Nitrospirae bacterium]|nr:MAG: hypothetical protein D6690_01945 [Nitrospirota bacterium]